jgi:hypothetical protein
MIAYHVNVCELERDAARSALRKSRRSLQVKPSRASMTPPSSALSSALPDQDQGERELDAREG